MKLRIFLAVLFLVNVAFALDITLEKDTLIAPLDGTNKVDVTFSGTDDTIMLSLVGEKQWMLLTPTQFTLKQGENVTVSLYASPKGDTAQGLYRVRLVAESSTTKEKKSADIFISVVKESGVYIEKILVSGDLEPTGAVKLELHLKNFGTSTVPDITVSGNVDGKQSLFVFSGLVDKIDPLKTAIVEKTFIIPEQAAAGEYTVKAQMSYQDVSRSFENRFTVAERPVIKKEIIDYSPFATGYSRAIKIKNYGNKAGDYTLKESISNFDAVFYSGTEPTSATSSEYAWKISNLKQGETAVVSYKVDYLPLILFLLAILIFSWYILVKLRTVRIIKFIMQKRMIEEGTEFTIGLDVKNAGGTNVSDAVVRDFVPSVFEVKESDGPRPVKRKSAHGTELEWKLSELFNKEERILSYKIIPVFGVHGQIALPRATARFKFGNKTIENKSNPTAVGVATKEKVPTLEDIFMKKKKK